MEAEVQLLLAATQDLNMVGDKSLANYQYDHFLASKGKTRELRERTIERRNANKGYEGWHFGLGMKPVYTKDKHEFKQALEKRGLMMRDDVKQELK